MIEFLGTFLHDTAVLDNAPAGTDKRIQTSHIVLINNVTYTCSKYFASQNLSIQSFIVSQSAETICSSELISIYKIKFEQDMYLDISLGKNRAAENIDKKLYRTISSGKMLTCLYLSSNQLGAFNI